jgi:pyruvate,orthophosphate dikinase
VQEKDEALAALLPMQRDDFVKILEAMDGLPVTIRLIDPPLHEFLPDYTDLSVAVALEDERGNKDTKHHQLLTAVKRLHEANPMLGLRGVRLGIVIPGLFAMQARAILEAAAIRTKAGGDPRPEIMIPLVATVEELDLVKKDIVKVAGEIEDEHGTGLTFMVGTMIELPRRGDGGREIARSAEFFSFGTNDLTQMTLGLLARRRRGVVLRHVPREGHLRGLAVRVARPATASAARPLRQRAGGATAPGPAPRRLRRARRRPRLDPLLRQVGLDYVSCSPFRVPVARLEAGRSASERVSDSA